ncbi:AI-2E family transporter [Eubacterium multiforme]|uniref:PurR-regulated permease PerM n=1 Tax=Eubacterium multiforme TaxID=83339 RepID=A0ABT9UR37_9FIRM|nr:AI-2E family transporter [Eubacterium multiforme]MDQ0148110.1 putative PurR-regulated permease PerM [Eubacterium multiforme]
MKLPIKNKTLIIRFILIFVIILFLVLYLNWKVFREVINIIIISALLAYILRPLRNLIIGKERISRRKATLIVMFGITLIIILILYILIPKLMKEMGNTASIIDKISIYINNIIESLKINNSSIGLTIYEEVEEKLWGYIMNLSQNTITWAINFTSNIASIAIIPIVTYYFLSDGEIISNKMYLLIPVKKRKIAKKIIEDVNLLLERYIVSQVILSIATGIMCLILFLILDIKFALLLSIINGIFNIVPYFGAFFGGIPAVLIAFFDSEAKGLWAIIGILVIQQIEGNILAPKVTADSTNIHPLLIIILLLIGEKLGGITGMVLAVPIGVILKVIYDDLNYYLF